jgi:hypothetical protein
LNTQDFVDYYENLLIREYNGLPKASAHIAAIVKPLLVPQSGEPIIPLAIQQAFDISTATGKQLEILGKYVGASKTGFDFSGAITLNDSQFRELIQIMAVRNRLSGKLSDIQDFIADFFPGVFQIIDNFNMRISYLYWKTIGSNPVAEIFIKMGALPKPLGVGMGLPIYAAPYTSFFGFSNNLGPAPSYISALSSNSVPLTGHVLDNNDSIPV